MVPLLCDSLQRVVHCGKSNQLIIRATHPIQLEVQQQVVQPPGEDPVVILASEFDYRHNILDPFIGRCVLDVLANHLPDPLPDLPKLLLLIFRLGVSSPVPPFPPSPVLITQHREVGILTIRRAWG